MKGGTRRSVIISALIRLQTTPVTTPTANAKVKDPVALKVETASTPDRASTDPAERSIIPLMIKMVSPKARIVVTDNCREMLERLLIERKLGLVKEQTKNSVSSTKKMLYFSLTTAHISPILSCVTGGSPPLCRNRRPLSRRTS